MAGRPKLNLMGHTFGRLTVVGEISHTPPERPQWLCRCVCGGERVGNSFSLRQGKLKSCGCLAKESITPVGDWNRTHGGTCNPALATTYSSWRSIHGRCRHIPSAEVYGYLAKGITVCDRWQSFEAFLADMGVRPAGTTIDRIDNDGNYEPGNCRWADWGTQHRNTSRTQHITVRGVTRCMTDWAKELGISPQTLCSRRTRKGLTYEAIIETEIALRGSL